MTEQKKNGKRLALWGLAGVLLAVAFYGVYLGWIKKDMSDFGVCYRNGGRILQGETLYRVSDGHLQFKYAPISALFYVPLALLPYPAAKIVWYYVELILFFWTFWILYKILPSRKKGPWFVLGLSLLVFLKFAGREIELGQVNILIIFILTLMLVEFAKKKDAPAGVLWGISLFFKPYALVFLPYFILRKRFKLLMTGLAVLIAGLALPALYFGFEGNLLVLKEWVSTLSRSTPGLMASDDAASLYAFLWKNFPGHSEFWVKTVWLAVCLALAAVFLGMMREAKKRALETPEILEAAFLMIMIPLISPLGWNYNYLYALPAVVLLMNTWSEFPSALKVLLTADFLLIGATLREILRKSLFDIYTDKSLVTPSFFLLLFFLYYLRRRTSARI